MDLWTLSPTGNSRLPVLNISQAELGREGLLTEATNCLVDGHFCMENLKGSLASSGKPKCEASGSGRPGQNHGRWGDRRKPAKRNGDGKARTRSSSREVRLRVPDFFSVVCFSRETLPTKKVGKRALLGDLVDASIGLAPALPCFHVCSTEFHRSQHARGLRC